MARPITPPSVAPTTYPERPSDRMPLTVYGMPQRDNGGDPDTLCQMFLENVGDLSVKHERRGEVVICVGWHDVSNIRIVTPDGVTRWVGGA